MQFFVKGYDILVKNKIYANLMVSLEVNMFKKVSLLCLMVLMVSCARQTSDQISQQSSGGTPIQPTIPSAYSALWQNYGSDVRNTNVVKGKLPAQSASLSEAATEAGFSVFSSPVIFQDSSTNAQSVVALWAKSDQLKVVRYTIGSSTLIPDPGFTAIKLTPNSAPKAHQAHQIALSIENNQPFIFVGHKGGVSKYNALTGALVKTVSTYGSVYRVLVSGTSLYIQSKSHLVKLNAVSMEVNFNMVLADLNIPTRQLPLVISGSYLYVVDGNDVIKVDTSNLSEAGKDTVSGSVAGLLAYNSTVLYSEVSAVDYGYKAVSDVNSRTVTQTNFKLFGGNFDTDFNTYIIQRRASNQHGGINNNIGDHSFTAFALTNSTLYLPGFSLELISNWRDTLQSGVVTVDRSSSSNIASFYGSNQQQVFQVNDVGGSGVNLSNHYVSRFLIVDSNTGQAMSVLNVNELLFQTKDTWGNSYKQVSGIPKISEELGASTNAFAMIVNHRDKTKLDAYNSRIMLGNSSSSTGLDALTFPNSTAIQAVSVGNQAVVLAGSDSKLYLLQ